jgi:hypothetical protein
VTAAVEKESNSGVGRHSIPGSDDAAGGDANPSSGRIPRADEGWQGRRRRIGGGRRGVSVGVIAVLAAVVVLVGGAILWRFFGDSLSKRSADAAQQCLRGTATVAVAADQSIAEQAAAVAATYNDQATPVGDTCVTVTVTTADTDAVLRGLSGSWPTELGEQPALWIPASSIASARLQAAAGKQIVSDARSLVITPVVMAVPPKLKDALGQRGWADLPGLQTDPAALDGINLPGWGSLRLALPTAGAGDAAYLTAEAVATTAAPPNTAPTAGLAAVSTLLTGQPRLADNSAGEAWKALTAPGDPAAAPVHAVAMTEQQLFTRSADMPDAKNSVAAWVPGGLAAVADYPTVLLSGPWLSEEQVSADSEFARFMRKPEQLEQFARAGFRAEGASPEATDVVGFPALAAPLPVADDMVRATVAAAVAPAGVATTTIMLNEGLTGVEGGKPRLTNVMAALRDRISALPPDASVGLWTFNKVDSGAAVPTGPLSEQLGNVPRSAALAGVLDATTPTSGGGVSFTTLKQLYADAVAKFTPGQQNSVLIITQGPHTDQSLDGPGLQDAVKSAADPNRTVAVNIVSFAGDPDRPTWEAVAAATGGSYAEVPASDSPDLTAAISRMLS